MCKNFSCKKVALFIAVLLVLQHVFIPVGSFANFLDEPELEVLDAVPVVLFEGAPIYNGLVLFENSPLMVSFEFTASVDSVFEDIAVKLPEPLVPSESGSWYALAIRDVGGQLYNGQVSVDDDKNVLFNFYSIGQFLGYESSSPSSLIANTGYTISFDIPVIFDLENIPDANGERYVYIYSDGVQVVVEVLAPIVMAAMEYYADGLLPLWLDVSSFRPLGSAHNFGAFVFGALDLEGGEWGGYFHSEGGIAVAGNVNLIGRTTADFGGAHHGVGVQITTPGPRLIVGGNLYADMPYEGRMGNEFRQAGVATPSNEEIEAMLAYIAGYEDGYAADYGFAATNERVEVRSPYDDYRYLSRAGWVHYPEFVVYLHYGDMIMTYDAYIQSRGRIQPFNNESPAPPWHGGNQPDADGYYNDWNDLPRVSTEAMEAYFLYAFTQLRALNLWFASEEILLADNVYAGGKIPTPPNTWTLPQIGPPDTQDAQGNYIFSHYNLIFDLEVSPDGRVYFPEIHFPSWFHGNFVINVDNNTNIGFPGDSILSDDNGMIYTLATNVDEIYQYVREYSHRIIWNFTGNGNIEVDYDLIIGAVLAPNSDFYASAGGSVNGELIVYNLIHAGGGFEQHTTSRLMLPGFVPDTPWPIMPEIPEVPSEPGTPEEPEVPTEPETPEEPEIPTEPGTPEEPEIPTEPGTPEEPEIPTEPEMPEEPEIPTEPETPEEPEIPSEPGTPILPIIPIVPIPIDIPSEPETPGEPEIPTEPATPGEPEIPTEPETPGEPEIPTEPETPGEPEIPTEPETPGEPEIPTEPGTPGEPEIPTEPETPGEPEIPTEPETPTAPPEISEPPTHPAPLLPPTSLTPDLPPGELPPGYTITRLEDESVGEDIIYIITNDLGVDIGFVIVPEGESIDNKVIYNWAIPLVGLNPQTSMRDFGIIINPLLAGIVAITVATVAVKKGCKRKEA